MNSMENNKSSLTIPAAIVVSGALIAGAVLYSNGDNNGANVVNVEQPAAVEQQVASTDNVRPVSDADHLRGNPDAPVVIVEYSDFECPFCKKFHNTMNQVIDEYGKDGKVAWVYRHFPLDQLHPVKARAEAIASECAADIGGKDAFWDFADRFLELSPSNNRTDLEVVFPQIVNELGLDAEKFEECVTSGKFDQKIEDDIEDAIATGGRGTPWSVVIAPNGKTFPINGAQPYSTIKQIIDLALQEK